MQQLQKEHRDGTLVRTTFVRGALARAAISAIACLSALAGCTHGTSEAQRQSQAVAQKNQTSIQTPNASGILHALPTPEPAVAGAAPKILAVQLSALNVHPGDTWTGNIITTTNVASLEVRAPSFTFNAERIGYGEFAFSVHAIFIPPIYRRVYTVTFVARNPGGATAERDIDVDFH
jgi:hypothetical protein